TMPSPTPTSRRTTPRARPPRRSPMSLTPNSDRRRGSMPIRGPAGTGGGAVAAHFMSWPALVVSPDDDVASTVAALARRGVEHALVKSAGRLCGVVCLIDLADAPSWQPVRWKMSIPAAVVSSATPAAEVFELLLATE